MKHILFGEEQVGRYRPIGEVAKYQRATTSLKRQANGDVDTKRNDVQTLSVIDVVETSGKYVVGQLAGTQDYVYISQNDVGLLDSHNMVDYTGRYTVIVTNVVPVKVQDSNGGEAEDGFALIGSMQLANEIMAHHFNRLLANDIPVYLNAQVLRIRERLTHNHPVARLLLQVETDTGLTIRFTVNMADITPNQESDANTGFIKAGTILQLRLTGITIKPFVSHDSRDIGRHGQVAVYQVVNTLNDELEEQLTDLAEGHKHSLFYVAMVDNKHKAPLVEVAPYVYFQGVLNENNPKTNQVRLLPTDGTQHTPVWGEVLSVRKAKDKNGRDVIRGVVRIDEFPYGTVIDKARLPY